MKAILILAFDVGGRNRFEERYAGMGVSELRRLKQLEDEKRRLRGLVADLMLDKQFCRRCCEKSPKARAPTETDA
jgi:hypothetical protein